MPLSHTVVSLVDNPCNPDSRVQRMAETLCNAGHSVTIVCKHADGLPKDEISQGVRYLRVPMRARPLRPRFGVFKFSAYESFVRKAVLAIRPTVIHANDLIALPAANSLARQLGAKVVLDIHDLYLHGAKKRSKLSQWHGERIERRHIRLADAVITVSNGIADHLRDTYGIERPVVVMNAPDPDAATPDGPSIETVRDALELGPEVPLGVYTGARHLVRGTGRLVSALAHVADLHLAMVGAAPAEVDRQLLSLARAGGCADRLHLLPPVPHELVSRYIATADFAVVPQHAECLNHEYSMPHKLFEAVFAGLPVAVSNLREMSDFVHGTGCGVVMNAKDVEDIAATMRKLVAERGRRIASPDRTAQLSRIYGWPSQARKLLAVYEQLEGRQADPPSRSDRFDPPTRRAAAS